MSQKNQKTIKHEVKEYGGHFRVMSLYLGVKYVDCRRQMKAHFLNLPDAIQVNNSKIKIDRWWDERSNIQEKGGPHVISFFEELADERGRYFDASWFNKKLETLLAEEPLLYAAIRKYKQPYAAARFHKDYAESNSALMKHTVNNYCHQYFYVYHIHTATKKLVRHVLKFHGHDEEKIFCNFYQYKKGAKPSVKLPDCTDIERWHGNVFSNNSFINISLVTPEYSFEFGPEYAHFVFPRMGDDKERLGIMTSLTDGSHSPAALPILIQRTAFKKLELNKLNDYVKVMSISNGENSKEINAIIKKIGNDLLIVKQAKNSEDRPFKLESIKRKK